MSSLAVGYWKQDLTNLWAYDEAKVYEEAKKLLKEGQNLLNGDTQVVSDEIEDKKEK